MKTIVNFLVENRVDILKVVAFVTIVLLTMRAFGAKYD